MEINGCSICKEWKPVKYPNRLVTPTHKEIKNLRPMKRWMDQVWKPNNIADDD
jgi:hypothetical protein